MGDARFRWQFRLMFGLADWDAWQRDISVDVDCFSDRRSATRTVGRRRPSRASASE